MPKKNTEIDVLLNLKNYLQQQLTIIHNELQELEKKKQAVCPDCGLEFRTKTLLKNHKCSSKQK